MVCRVTCTPDSTSERSTSLRRPFIHAIEGHHPSDVSTPDFYGTLARRGGAVGATDPAARAAPGIALGGQACARLAARFQWRTSPDTLLRLVQAAPVPDTPAPHIIGVDEGAWAGGRTCGPPLAHLRGVVVE